MTKHTPGPWDAAIDMKIRARGSVVGAVYAQPNGIDRANATLVAAAPDLLESLYSIERLLRDSPCAAAHVLAIAAIAKATEGKP